MRAPSPRNATTPCPSTVPAGARPSFSTSEPQRPQASTRIVGPDGSGASPSRGRPSSSSTTARTWASYGRHAVVYPRRLVRRRLPAALRERDYARLVAAIVAMGFAREMVLVAVGWQVYGISRNPLHLGLVGLAEFLPLPLLALPAGALADR